MKSFKQFLKEGKWKVTSKSELGTHHVHETGVRGHNVAIWMGHNHEHNSTTVDFSVDGETDAARARTSPQHAISIIKHIHRTVKKKMKDEGIKTAVWNAMDTDQKTQDKKERVYRGLARKHGLTVKDHGMGYSSVTLGK